MVQVDRSIEEMLEKLGITRLEHVPSYVDFWERQMPSDVTGTIHLAAGGSEVDAAGTMQRIYAHYLFNRSGRRTYELCPEIARALLDTDLPEDTPVDELRTPVVCQRLEIPDELLMFKGQRIQRIYVSRVEGDAFRVVFLYDTREQISCFAKIQVDKPEMTIREAIAQAEKHTDEWTQAHPQFAGTVFTVEEAFHGSVFRLAVNAMLYLVDPESDVKLDMRERHRIHQQLQGEKRKRRRQSLEKQAQRVKSNPRYVVGASFRLQREYTSEFTEAGRKWALEHRVCVAGHWKNQPHGPKRSLRKRIWVAPYWKGPTHAELVERKLVVR